MGKVDDSSTFSDNDWEEVKEKSDEKIKEWIDSQMAMRSCIVVLVGATTAGRKWINYEIEKAYELKKGIVGIYIHGLKDKNENQTTKGKNPFDEIYVGEKKEKLSKYVAWQKILCRRFSTKVKNGAVKQSGFWLISPSLHLSRQRAAVCAPQA